MLKSRDHTEQSTRQVMPRRHSSRSLSSGRRVRGATLVEVLVAFLLLVTMTTIAVPTVVRHGRLRQAIRQERVALDELSNQLDQLTLQSPQQLQGLGPELPVSRIAESVLPQVTLTIESRRQDATTRITLRIRWDTVGRRTTPLQMSAWIPDPPREERQP